MNIAIAQYHVEAQPSWDAYVSKITSWIQEAASNGAQVLVFPEYASLELASLLAPHIQADVKLQLPALQAFLPDFVELHRSLAALHGVYVVAGSFPVADGGKYVNRAYFLTPQGTVHHQDKLVMTRFEDEKWGVAAGEGLTVFHTSLGNVGINICYDSEFPHLARALAEGGAEVLLVPSCTETIMGYHRVEIGSRARALENQMYAVQSPLVGAVPWNEAIDVNTGAAGAYGPIDHGFSAQGDGVVTKGPLGVATWVYVTLDIARLRRVRADGTTLNYQHWPLGEAQAKGGAEVVTLGVSRMQTPTTA
ncbi:carbon-nitrogen hydrolase family protein [Deinococcus yavapaiensis]|uniref:Putative amidohydrolase n=1 Tax=Deinococcus yavapaiensis KR-236 TaxID=694435 RepID=A0A318S976_9DEIO|nr:carbon-nitrogen hydrolase family protein [Deinococcus yavapaiensis]PYE54537.1 putative amidohydrolase [Deinococcus yavapaiensis KR-236]